MKALPSQGTPFHERELIMPRPTRRKTPISPPERRSIALGKSKGFEELFAADLRVDRDVQRAFDNRHAAKLEADWDNRFIGTLIVSRRPNGDLYTIDGQHRVVVALRKDPVAIMDCEVYEGLSVVEEALMFLHYNRNRKAPNAFDHYKIGLVAQLPTEVRMSAETMQLGLELSPSKGNRQIAAVAACRRIVGWDKEETGLLRDTLMYAEMAFGARPETWDANLVQAIARVIHHHRATIDYDRLVEKLRSKHPDEWQALALMGAKGGGGSVSRSIAMERLFVFEYNKRLSPARKLR